MPKYQFYRLNGCGTILDRATEHECIDDTSAFEIASQKIGDGTDAIEIWCGRRLIGRVPH